MKLKFAALALAGLLTIKIQDSRWGSLCNTWKLIGIKSFKKDFRPAKSEVDEIMTFNSDGTYDKLLYGQMKMKGNWKFSSDSTKLSFNISSMNGNPVPVSFLNNSHPTDSIIKLTTDTLIIGRLAWFGSELEYGHDDWYYVHLAKTQ